MRGGSGWESCRRRGSSPRPASPGGAPGRTRRSGRPPGGAAWAGVLALALLVAPAAARAGIFDREQEDVAAGNRALEAGDAEEALRRYRAAARDHSGAPEVAHDRGIAHLAAGQPEEALSAFAEALALRGAGAAAAADHAGIGTALASLGRVDEAKAEFRRALELDPDQETARRNLEALLRREERQDPQEQESEKDSDRQQAEDESDRQQDGEPGDDSDRDSGERAGDDPEAPDDSGQRAEDDPRDGSGDDAGSEAGEERAPQPEPTEPEPQDGQQASAGEGEESREESPGIPQAVGPAEGAAPAGPIDRTEAEQLLDALQAGERPFQLYRRQRGRGERTDHDKDW